MTTQTRHLHPVIELGSVTGSTYTAVPTDRITGEVVLTQGMSESSLSAQPNPEPARLRATIHDVTSAYDDSSLLLPGSRCRMRMAATGDGGTLRWSFYGRLVSRKTESMGTYGRLYRCEWASSLHRIMAAQGPDLPYVDPPETTEIMLQRLAMDAGITDTQVEQLTPGTLPAWFVALPRGAAGLRAIMDLADGIILEGPGLVSQSSSGTVNGLRLVTWGELRTGSFEKNRNYTDLRTVRSGEVQVPAAIWHEDPFSVITAAECEVTYIAPRGPMPVAMSGALTVHDPATKDAVSIDHEHPGRGHEHGLPHPHTASGHSHSFSGSGGSGENAVTVSGTTSTASANIADATGDTETGEADVKPLEQDLPEVLNLFNYTEDKPIVSSGTAPTTTAPVLTADSEFMIGLPELEERVFPCSVVDSEAATRFGRREAAQPIRFALVSVNPLPPAFMPPDDVSTAYTALAQRIVDRYKTPVRVYEILHHDDQAGIRGRAVGDSENLRLRGGFRGRAIVMRMETKMLRDGLVIQRVWYRARPSA